MKHTVVIDDSTPKGAELMELIRHLPENTVKIVDEDEETVSAEEFFSALRAEVERKFREKDTSK